MAAPARPRWKPDKDDQADLDAMNIVVARIQRHTPKDPYFLEIPQENGVRYHHHHSQRHQWTRDTPFDPLEKESLQYQTFHLYEQGKELFEQHSTHLETSSVSRSGAVRAGTPSAAPKNKMSFDAYKKKQKNALATPDLNAQKASDAQSKQAAVKGPVERAKAETDEMLAEVAELEQEGSLAKKSEVQAPSNDLKRKRDERERQDRAGVRKGEALIEDSEPATKKAKSLPDKPVERQAVQKQQQRKPGVAAISKDDVVSGTLRPDEQQLPPRLSPQLSPLLPARLSPLPHLAAMSLPPRLTPTIPLNISKALDEPAASQSSLFRAPKADSGSKDTTLIPNKREVDRVTKPESPLPPHNGFRAGSRSPAGPAQLYEKVQSGMSVPQPQEVSPADEIVVAKTKKEKPIDSPSEAQVLQKPRLLLKLKYRKSQASAIKRILGMRVAPDKSMLVSQSTEERKSASEAKTNGDAKDGSNVRGVAQIVGPARKEKKAEKSQVAGKRPPIEKPLISSPTKQANAAKQPVAEKQLAAEKRPLPEEERHESSAKRKKDEPPAVRKDPSTPAQQAVESPSGSKSQLQATPSAKNNLLAVAMARDKSQDSNSTQTPPGTINTPSISGISQLNGTARPPSSQPSGRNAKQQAWTVEARTYEKLGKELKHVATAHLQNKLPNLPASPIDQKLGAVKAIESFISFMVGFCCLDEVGQVADSRPIPPEIRNWQSLQGFQGFVKRSSEHFPALSGLTASLSAVFAARVLEIATQYHREDGITRDQIFDMQALLTKSAIEASAKLDVDILQDSFPKTWKQRSKTLSNREKLELGKLGGQYKLPIGLATSPVRAARAGCAILREWLEGESINYVLKLKL